MGNTRPEGTQGLCGKRARSSRCLAECAGASQGDFRAKYDTQENGLIRLPRPAAALNRRRRTAPTPQYRKLRVGHAHGPSYASPSAHGLASAQFVAQLLQDGMRQTDRTDRQRQRRIEGRPRVPYTLHSSIALPCILHSISFRKPHEPSRCTLSHRSSKVCNTIFGYLQHHQHHASATLSDSHTPKISQAFHVGQTPYPCALTRAGSPLALHIRSCSRRPS